MYVKGKIGYKTTNGITYRIRYIPRKILSIRPLDDGKRHYTYTCSDCRSFLGRSFERSLELWHIHIPRIITQGKRRREGFRPSDMEFMVKYNAAGLAALVRLMLALEKKLDQVGVHLHSYHGAGVIASYFLSEPKIAMRTECQPVTSHPYAPLEAGRAHRVA